MEALSIMPPLNSAAGILVLALAAHAAPPGRFRSWTAYGGGPENIKYSALRQVNISNVARLQPAWTYDTHDAFDGSEMECNPIVVNGVLYTTSPKLRIIALDAATGKLRWEFNPDDGTAPLAKVRNRGLTYARGRIYVAFRQWLYALDARTGRPAAPFGRSGRVDLREGLGRPVETLSVSATTPGVVYGDLLILGSIVPEDLPSAPGDIRAYDLASGRVRWTFHTIPHPGEYGYDTWPPDAWRYSGGANNWAGMSLDEKRGLVFVPTGSAAFDFYGADRHGDNLFANCLLALDAKTGKRVWHFQGVHHDIWDRDFPAPPTLVTVARGGKRIEAVAQTTKSGHVYVFERATGKPLFPIEERAYPASGVDGELTAKTQPLPTAPPPFARQAFTEEMVTRRTPEAHEAVLERLRKLRNGGAFVPPSLEGTVIFPGFDGGAEWGGAAFDPGTHLLYVNANEMVWIARLIERPRTAGETTASKLYVANCATCHRLDLRGSPPEFPSLADIASRRNAAEVESVVRKGAGRMPAFARLPEPAVQALVRYVMTGADAAVSAGAPENRLKYGLDGYIRFTDPDGYPAVEPPWGTLNAIQLDTGEIAWRVPLGEHPELAAKGLTDTGSENYGGPLVTAGGLVFIAATTRDNKIRAFDKRSGKLLWEGTLPAAGNATPATYEVRGRQFVVIAAGGGKWGAASGGSYVAFALPQ